MDDRQRSHTVSIWQRPTSVATVSTSSSFALLIPEPFPPPFRSRRYAAVIIGSWHGDFKSVAPYRFAAYDDASEYLKSRGFSDTRDGFRAVLGASIEASGTYLVVVGLKTADSDLLTNTAEVLPVHREALAVRSFPLYGNADESTVSVFRPPKAPTQSLMDATLERLLDTVVPLSREEAFLLLHGYGSATYRTASVVDYMWSDTQRKLNQRDDKSTPRDTECVANRQLAAYFFDHGLGYLVSPAIHAEKSPRYGVVKIALDNRITCTAPTTHLDFHASLLVEGSATLTCEVSARIIVTDRHLDGSDGGKIKARVLNALTEPQPLASRDGMVPVVQIWVPDPGAQRNGARDKDPTAPKAFAILECEKLSGDLAEAFARCRKGQVKQLVVMIHASLATVSQVIVAVDQALFGNSGVVVPNSASNKIVTRRYYPKTEAASALEDWPSKALRTDLIAASVNGDAVSAADLMSLGPMVRSLVPQPIERAFARNDPAGVHPRTFRLTFALEAASKLHSVAFNVLRTSDVNMPRGAMTLTVLGGMTLAPLHQTVLLHAADIVIPMGSGADPARVELLFPDTAQVPSASAATSTKAPPKSTMVEVQSKAFLSSLGSALPAPPVRFVTFIFELCGQQRLSMGHLWLSGTMLSPTKCTGDVSTTTGPVVEQLLALAEHSASRVPSSGAEFKARLHRAAGIPRATLTLGAALQSQLSAVHDPEWYFAGVNLNHPSDSSTRCRGCGVARQARSAPFEKAYLAKTGYVEAGPSCPSCVAEQKSFAAYPDTTAARELEPCFRRCDTAAAVRTSAFADWDLQKPRAAAKTMDGWQVLSGLELEWLGVVGEPRCPFTIDEASRVLASRSGGVTKKLMHSIGVWLEAHRGATCHGLQCRVLLPVWTIVRAVRLVLLYKGTSSLTIRFDAAVSPTLNVVPESTTNTTELHPNVLCSIQFEFAASVPVKLLHIWSADFIASGEVHLVDLVAYGHYPRGLNSETASRQLTPRGTPTSNLFESSIDPSPTPLQLSQVVELPTQLNVRADAHAITAVIPKPAKVAGIHLALQSNCGVRAVRLYLVSATGRIHPVRLLHLPVVEPGHREAKPCIKEWPNRAAASPSPQLGDRDGKVTAAKEWRLSFTMPDTDLRGEALRDVESIAVHLEVSLKLVDTPTALLADAVKCAICEWAPGGGDKGEQAGSVTSLDVGKSSTVNDAATFEWDNRGPSLFRVVGERRFDAEGAEDLFLQEERDHFAYGRHAGFYY